MPLSNFDPTTTSCEHHSLVFWLNLIYEIRKFMRWQEDEAILLISSVYDEALFETWKTGLCNSQFAFQSRKLCHLANSHGPKTNFSSFYRFMLQRNRMLQFRVSIFQFSMVQRDDDISFLWDKTSRQFYTKGHSRLSHHPIGRNQHSTFSSLSIPTSISTKNY